MPLKITHLAIVALTAALSGGVAHAGGFTADQAAAGETAYNSNCAQCHGKQLEGPDAPGLAGPDVMQNWATAGGLYDFIHVAMPPSAPGQLGDETYLNIIAYIMKFNGAQPGDEPMTAVAARGNPGRRCGSCPSDGNRTRRHHGRSCSGGPPGLHLG